MKTNEQARSRLLASKRVVVKVGSRLLVQRTGRPESRRLRTLVRQLAKIHNQDKELVFVSSGAIGAGMESLKRTSRPSRLPELQMAAAVGQVRLMGRYERLFSSHRCKVGQVLLTHEDLKSRTRHLNARNTMHTLLKNKIIPIVNENDVVSVDEIKVGDNDTLAALVAMLVEADLLILLTTTNGLRAPLPSGRTKRIPFLESVNEEALSHVFPHNDKISTGGMKTKLEAAQLAADSGANVVIADGSRKDVLLRILAGEDEGTLIPAPINLEAHPARKKWIAFFQRCQGSIVIDQGAVNALIKRGTSLLPVGISKIEGQFDQGALINIKDNSGETLARGLSSYSSEELGKIKGCQTAELNSILGNALYEEAIHRDNLVIL